MRNGVTCQECTTNKVSDLELCCYQPIPCDGPGALVTVLPSSFAQLPHPSILSADCPLLEYAFISAMRAPESFLVYTPDLPQTCKQTYKERRDLS